MSDPRATSTLDSSTRKAIESTVRDYVEGWYTGNVERMDRALHDDLVKRTPDGDDHGALLAVTKARMLELTASAGGGGATDVGTVIDIDGVVGTIAAARVISPDFVDYLHLTETEAGWRIVNILFLYDG